MRATSASRAWTRHRKRACGIMPSKSCPERQWIGEEAVCRDMTREALFPHPTGCGPMLPLEPAQDAGKLEAAA